MEVLWSTVPAEPVTRTSDAPGRRSPERRRPLPGPWYQFCDVVTKKKKKRKKNFRTHGGRNQESLLVKQDKERIET
jgi:hypothetical protein